MKNCLVRDMKEEDCGVIAQLEEECFSSPWTKDQLLESLLNKDYTFLVAEIDGHVAGYAGMVRAYDEGDITDVGVFSKFRRQGAADALMTELADRAEKAGLVSVFLEVRESNAPARALYEKQGYKAIGLRKNFYERPVENAVLMKLSLSQEEI